MESRVFFRENQQFRQPWLWALIGGRAVLTFVGLVRGKRSGREATRELVTLGAAALLLRVATLQTEVRDDGLYLKFSPFHRSFKRIPFSDLADVQATGYSPLRYGGWGIRWSPSGVAYTVSDRSGVRFEREGGKSVYVGSKRPDELLAAVQEATDQTV